jgi:hypothetical protein
MDVEVTLPFERWWDDLADDVQDNVAFGIRLVEEGRVTLDGQAWSEARPPGSVMVGELPIPIRRGTCCVFYIWEVERGAIVLIGGVQA